MSVRQRIHESSPLLKLVMFPSVIICVVFIWAIVGLVGISLHSQLADAGVLSQNAIWWTSRIWTVYSRVTILIPFVGAVAWGWYGRGWIKEMRSREGR